MKITSAWRAGVPLVAAPLIALGAQSIAYALVAPLCARQAGGWLHAVFALALLASVALSWTAWHERRRQAQPRRFLAAVAATVGVLSSVVLLAMWLPVALLSPCQG